ncbi:hypothetical protein [Chlorobium sp. N1]|uniref:hypothetical protein n=1 Tax=Chlorobium sp. N1 TaxID=2491138 RepID=UPI00103B43A2|nr:hypothetical protein [Chlorobium sp. N1]TCD48599.1 hypothetical protein E0L29_01600 [Chlorobium sp. N1]
MILVLLILAVVLLSLILLMMLSGWPGRERRALDEMGRQIYRELAEHRSETVQLLHAMKIELEESLREAVEEEVGSFAPAGPKRVAALRRAPAPRRAVKLPPQPAISSGNEGAGSPASVAEEAGPWPSSVEQSGQLQLFEEDRLPSAAPSPRESPTAPPEPPSLPPEEEMVRVYAADDLPDVD